MKKLSILLSLVLVLALSTSAFAALSTNITGYVEMDVTYKRDLKNKDDLKKPVNEIPYRLSARTKARVQLTMSAGSASNANPRVTVTLKTADNHQSGWLKFDTDFAKAGTMPFEMTAWNLVATGPLWKDGPSLTTTLGDVVRDWNKYTAWQLGPNIIEVAGLKVGQLNVTGLYSWNRADSRYNKKAGTNTGALRVQGTLNQITLDATVTNVGPQVPTATDKRHNNFYVDAKVTPTTGVDLRGIVAYDGENQGLSYKAEATVKTIPNLTLTGLVRGTDTKFNPQHTETHADHRVWWSDEQYYKVTAETTQAGVTLSGSYALKSKYNGADPVNTVEVKASTTIDNALPAPLTVGGTVTFTMPEGGNTTTKTVIDASTTLVETKLTYKGTIETDKPVKNELTAERTLNLPFADNVKVNGKVTYQPDGTDADNDPDTFDYGIDAAWQLPNGLDIWVGYANYNKSGDDWVNEKGPDGFYIRVHRRISF